MTTTYNQQAKDIKFISRHDEILDLIKELDLSSDFDNLGVFYETEIEIIVNIKHFVVELVIRDLDYYKSFNESKDFTLFLDYIITHNGI